MTIEIDDLSREELVALNRRIVERFKMLDTLATQQSMMQLHPGARVSFAPSSGERLIGILMKFNQKTVTVITDEGNAGTSLRNCSHRSKMPPAATSLICPQNALTAIEMRTNCLPRGWLTAYHYSNHRALQQGHSRVVHPPSWGISPILR